MAIRSGVRRRVQTAAPAALDPARTMLGAEQEQWLFDNLATREGALDRDRPAGLLVRARHPGGRSDGALLDGQVGRLRAARSRLYARLKETKRPIRSCCREMCTCTTAPISSSISPTRVGDGRRRVHEHVDFRGRRRRRRGRDVGADPARQPAHQVPQRAPRLHRLHRHAGADARRLQDPRPGHGAGRRPSASAARWSSRPDGRARRLTRSEGSF